MPRAAMARSVQRRAPGRCEGVAKRPGALGKHGWPVVRPEGPYIAVVRRGETAILRMLLESLGTEAGPVQVVWDRRLGDRRRRRRPTLPERRRSERRGPSPAAVLTLRFSFARCRTPR